MIRPFRVCARGAATTSWKKPFLPLLALLFLSLVATSVTGCAGRQKVARNDYSGQAQYAYEEALDAYNSSEYLEAFKRLNYVRTKFPYSKYSALASLRIGDTYFAQSQMSEAVEAYRRFTQLHPTHPEVPYAQYRIGLAYYEQLPSDWFFLPPAYEKDLASTADAARALEKFLTDYPESDYTKEINEKLIIVRQRLADHEFFVATFYLEREQPRAAAMRFQSLLDSFSGVGFDEEALFLLGKCYLLLRDVPQAVSTWRSLIEQFPEHPLARQADSYIQSYNLQNSAPYASSQP